MLAGASKGISDAIAHHNSYAKSGYFWSTESWKIKYNPKTFMQKFAAKIMGASWNAWHLFDWIRNGCYVAVIFMAYYAPYHNPLEWAAASAFQLFFFLVFFKIFYR